MGNWLQEREERESQKRERELNQKLKNLKNRLRNISEYQDKREKRRILSNIVEIYMSMKYEAFDYDEDDFEYNKQELELVKKEIEKEIEKEKEIEMLDPSWIGYKKEEMMREEIER